MSDTYIITTDALVRELAERLLSIEGQISTAESCTGGMLASVLTNRAGASQWFHSGFVTYSNQAKIAQLDVAAAVIESYGAVSEQVAQAMAQGAQARTNVSLSVSITGIAGPDGASAEKPIGTVCLGLTLGKTSENLENTNAPIITKSQTHHLTGNRNQIREQSVLTALRFILSEFTPMVQRSKKVE